MDYFFALFPLELFPLHPEQEQQLRVLPSSRGSLRVPAAASLLLQPVLPQPSAPARRRPVRSGWTFVVTPGGNLNFTHVNGITDVERGNIHRNEIRQIARQTFDR